MYMVAFKLACMRSHMQVIAGNTNSDQPEEQEWEARKERMAQVCKWGVTMHQQHITEWAGPA